MRRKVLFLLTAVMILCMEKGLFAWAEQNFVLIEKLSFEETDSEVRITIETNQPIDLLDYEIDDPVRIIVDPLGDVFGNLNETLPIFKGMVKEIKVIKSTRTSPRNLNESYYPIDFFVIELKEPTSYRLRNERNTVSLEVESEGKTQMTERRADWVEEDQERMLEIRKEIETIPPTTMKSPTSPLSLTPEPLSGKPVSPEPPVSMETMPSLPVLPTPEPLPGKPVSPKLPVSMKIMPVLPIVPSVPVLPKPQLPSPKIPVIPTPQIPVKSSAPLIPKPHIPFQPSVETLPPQSPSLPEGTFQIKQVPSELETSKEAMPSEEIEGQEIK